MVLVIGPYNMDANTAGSIQGLLWMETKYTISFILMIHT